MKIFLCLFTAFFLQLPIAQAAQETSSEAAQQIAQADALLSDDKLNEALAAYKTAVKNFPNNSEAHQRLAKALSLAGDLEDAQRENRRAIQLDPLNAQAHSNLGWILGVQKKYYDSIEAERIAIHLNPSIASSHLTLALSLASVGNYEGALQANKAAISLEPDNLKAHINLAAILGRKGDYAQAIETYKKALEIAPDSVTAHLGLGAALGKTGLLKEQIQEFKTAVALAPGSDNAHGKLGVALYKAGDWDGALREGCITNWLRLSKSGPEYLRTVIGLWGGIFLLFGIIFAAIFFSCQFTPMTGEIVDKSYFLIFHNEKPGRFIVTNRRFAFIPEAFSQWFGSKPVSIERDQIEKIDPQVGGKFGALEITLKDGNVYSFTMPPLVAKPLMKNIGQEPNPS